VNDTNSQTIHGDFGDAIRVSVAAFDEHGNIGPRSDPSEEVLFVEAPTPTPQQTATPTPPPPAPTQTPTPSPTPATQTPPPDEPPASETPVPTNRPHGGRQAPAYAGPAVACDFNGDGHADILLHNETTGEVEMWQMRGSEIFNEIALPSMDPSWRTAGLGDFNSDGATDILWYDDRSGTARIWLMGGFTGDEEFDTQLPAGWVVAGVGDFDGDGRSEIAIWNRSTRLEFWGLNGGLVRLAQIPVHPHREIAAFGDVDGDGDDDIIIQDHRKRRIEALLMSADFTAQRVLLDRQKIAQWDVIDGGDFDGNGQSDLLWRNLSSKAPGSAGVWNLSSSLKLSGSPLDLNLGVDRTVVGSADYDGDGTTDLLVFDPATHELVLWLMAGSGAHRFESLGTLAPDWLPAGFNTDDTVIR
jgi:hypothetical protein